MKMMTFTEYENTFGEFLMETGRVRSWYEESEMDEVMDAIEADAIEADAIEAEEQIFTEVTIKEKNKVKKIKGVIKKWFGYESYGFLTVPGYDRDVHVKIRDFNTTRRPYIGSKVKIGKIEQTEKGYVAKEVCL
jgi:cold shock CspA family protein